MGQVNKKPIKLKWSISVDYKNGKALWEQCHGQMQAAGSCWEGKDKQLRQDIFHHPAVTEEFTPKSFDQKYYHGLSSKIAYAFFSLKKKCTKSWISYCSRCLQPPVTQSLRHRHNCFALEQSWGSLGFTVVLINRHQVHVEQIQGKTEKILYWFLLSRFNSSRRDSKCSRRTVLLHLLLVAKQKNFPIIITTQTPTWQDNIYLRLVSSSLFPSWDSWLCSYARRKTMIEGFSLVLHFLNIKRRQWQFCWKEMWYVTFSQHASKLLLMWSKPALFSKLCQEEAITLQKFGGMEITVGHFTAKSSITLIMNHLKPSHSPL